MKGPPIDQLVYAHMFPKPKSTDPQNFQGLLQRQLVPEVRHETQAFYGHLSSQEAKYPGLDYSYQPHRNRLSRYPWHRRLFRTFDALKLTESEIAGLTKWEGTRWAKERFEREQGVVIRDTTGDGIEDWVEPEFRIPAVQRPEIQDSEDREMGDNVNREEENAVEEDEDMDDEDEDSDVEIRSVGIELNERLRAAVAQREAGNAATVMDEEWEQWLKDAVEAGGIPFLPSASDLSPNANIPGTRPATNDPPMHPRLLNAARLGQWQQIPDFLHDMVRQNIEANNRRMEDSLPSPPATGSTTTAPLDPDSVDFMARSNTGPRARAVPITGATPGRIDSRTITRLDRYFSEQFTRRPIPPLPAAVSSVGGLSTAARGRLSRNTQNGSTS